MKEVSCTVGVAAKMASPMGEALAQRGKQITNESLSGLSEVRDRTVAVGRVQCLSPKMAEPTQIRKPHSH